MFLHPLGVDRSALGFSLFAAFENSFVVIENELARATMFAVENRALAALAFAFLGIRVVFSVGVFAQAFQVLGTEDGDVLKHLANALGRPAVDLALFNVVEEVVLVPVPAETRRLWAYCPTVRPFRVPPLHVQSVLPRIPDVLLELLELLLTHHLPPVRVPHYVHVL